MNKALQLRQIVHEINYPDGNCPKKPCDTCFGRGVYVTCDFTCDHCNGTGESKNAIKPITTNDLLRALNIKYYYSKIEFGDFKNGSDPFCYILVSNDSGDEVFDIDLNKEVESQEKEVIKKLINLLK